MVKTDKTSGGGHLLRRDKWMCTTSERRGCMPAYDQKKKKEKRKQPTLQRSRGGCFSCWSTVSDVHLYLGSINTMHTDSLLFGSHLYFHVLFISLALNLVI